MTPITAKRNLLRGRISSELPLRPPWSLEESKFIEVCTRCKQCAEACPLNVIKIASGGYPEIDFSQSGCDFCEKCASVCESSAISIDANEAFDLKASVSQQCFSNRGVICRSCGDVCDNQAITFKLVVGGTSQLIMNTEQCNGCGECISICPEQAISMKHRDSLTIN